MWHVNTMEYYSTLKLRGLFIHEKTWINLKIIMLSKRSHTVKGTYYMILFMKISRTCKPISNDRKQISDYLGRQRVLRGERGICKPVG